MATDRHTKARQQNKRELAMSREIERLNGVISDMQRPMVNCAEAIERPKSRSVELTQELEALNNNMAHLMSRQKELERDLSDTKDALAQRRLQHMDNAAALKELLAQPQVVA